MENKLDRNDLIYKAGNKKMDKTFDFQKFKTIRSFGREIYINNLSLDNALEQKIRLKDDIDIIKESTKLKESIREQKKHQPLKLLSYFLTKGKNFLMFLKVENFQKEIKEKDLQVF